METILRKQLQQLATIVMLLTFTVMTNSCKKDIDKTTELARQVSVTYAYEVDCNYCTITYNNESNQAISIKNNVGKWSYKIDTKFSFDLKVSVVTLNAAYQSIQAYVLKNDEVVIGNIGFNRAEVTYNTGASKGTSSFGTYASTSPSAGNGSGGSTAPTSSLCGAKNKTGGYCKRMVVGGGRCWQHK